MIIGFDSLNKSSGSYLKILRMILIDIEQMCIFSNTMNRIQVSYNKENPLGARDDLTIQGTFQHRYIKYNINVNHSMIVFAKESDYCKNPNSLTV